MEKTDSNNVFSVCCVGHPEREFNCLLFQICFRFEVYKNDCKQLKSIIFHHISTLVEKLHSDIKHGTTYQLTTYKSKYCSRILNHWNKMYVVNGNI